MKEVVNIPIIAYAEEVWSTTQNPLGTAPVIHQGSRGIAHTSSVIYLTLGHQIQTFCPRTRTQIVRHPLRQLYLLRLVHDGCTHS